MFITNVSEAFAHGNEKHGACWHHNTIKEKAFQKSNRAHASVRMLCCVLLFVPANIQLCHHNNTHFWTPSQMDLVAIKQAISFLLLSVAWEHVECELIDWICVLWCMWLAWIPCLSQREVASEQDAHKLESEQPRLLTHIWGAVVLARFKFSFSFCLREQSEAFLNTVSVANQWWYTVVCIILEES